MRVLNISVGGAVVVLFVLPSVDIVTSARASGQVALMAQESLKPPAEDAPFEIASIRECRTTDHLAPINSSPGRLRLQCWPLRRLVQEAYDVFASGNVNPLNPSFPLTPLEGVPDWVNSARYSIEANTAKPESVARMRGPIMQRLLEQRFALKIHREVREVPAFLMTVAAGGPKLKAAQEGGCRSLDPLDLTQKLSDQPGAKPWCIIAPPRRDAGQVVWDVHGISLGVFSKLLNPGLPVLDRTGLSGSFDIHLEWALEPPNPEAQDAVAADLPGMSLIVALQKQLGLKLNRGKGPREFLVIDNIDRPSAN